MHYLFNMRDISKVKVVLRGLRRDDTGIVHENGVEQKLVSIPTDLPRAAAQP